MNDDAITPEESVKLDEIGRDLFNISSQQAQNLDKTVVAFESICEDIKQNHVSAQSANEAVQLVEKQSALSVDQMSSLRELIGFIKNFQENMVDISGLVASIKNSIAVLEDLSIKSEKLSYNAEIEAARSGHESGRFAVIAEEIRTLTDLSRQATDAISGIVEKSVTTVSRYSDQMKHNLQRGSTVINDVEDAFRTISRLITDMSGEVTGISESSAKNAVVIDGLKNSVKTEVETHSLVMSQLLEKLTGVSIKDISPKEASQQLSRFHIIDVRSSDEFVGELGHVENARLISIKDDDFISKISELPRDQTYLFVCRSGGRSARAARVAQGVGLKSVFNLAGGMLAWNESGLEVVDRNRESVA